MLTILQAKDEKLQENEKINKKLKVSIERLERKVAEAEEKAHATEGRQHAMLGDLQELEALREKELRLAQQKV